MHIRKNTLVIVWKIEKLVKNWNQHRRVFEHVLWAAANFSRYRSITLLAKTPQTLRSDRCRKQTRNIRLRNAIYESIAHSEASNEFHTLFKYCFISASIDLIIFSSASLKLTTIESIYSICSQNEFSLMNQQNSLSISVSGHNAENLCQCYNRTHRKNAHENATQIQTSQSTTWALFRGDEFRGWKVSWEIENNQHFDTFHERNTQTHTVRHWVKSKTSLMTLGCNFVIKNAFTDKSRHRVEKSMKELDGIIEPYEL